MKAAPFLPLLFIALTLGAGVLAQESPGYQMKQHDLNAGGSPKDGVPLASSHYEIMVSSIGDGLAVTGMGSPGYRLSAGFPSTTATSAAPCILDCAADVPAVGKVAHPVAFKATATSVGCTGTPAFAWTFGNGNTSSEQNPSHTYAAAGPYTWSLVVALDDQTCTRGGAIQIDSSVPGDCDGTGEVSIGEVQKAINMFLEIQAVSCGVDCNADGTVSIGEVQKVINAFLGGAVSC